LPSYVEKYNYDKVQPFQTDYAGILKGLEVKEAYWKQGVQRVKTAYESAAGLAISGDIAKNRLKTFMEGANEQLKKALSNDLSMYDNAASAISIYAPLYKDVEMMDNHKNTTYYQSEFAKINRDRTKNAGKDYNELSAQDVMNHYQDFKKGIENGDESKDYLDKQVSYTPYYDVSKESLELLKQCKPNKETIMFSGEDPLTYETKTNNSLTASKIAGCLDQLSDKAKYQIALRKKVQYHNNPEGLALAWRNIGATNIEEKTERLTKARLLANENKIDPVKFKYWTEFAASLSGEIDKLQEGLGDINRGDYSDVSQNMNRYAYQLAVISHAREMGNEFATPDTSNEFSLNEANAIIQKQNFQTLKDANDFKNEIFMSDKEHGQNKELEEIKVGNSYKTEEYRRTGSVSTDPNSAPLDEGIVLKQSTTEDKEGNIYAAQLNAEVASASKSIVDAGNTLSNKLSPAKIEDRDAGFYTGIGADINKGFDPNIAINRDQQITYLESVVKAYNTIENENELIRQKNRVLPKDKQVAEIANTYRTNTVNAIKDYLSVVEEKSIEIETKKKIIEINQARVDKEIPSITEVMREVDNKTVNYGSQVVKGNQLREALTNSNGKSNDGSIFIKKEMTNGRTGVIDTKYIIFKNGQEIPQIVNNGEIHSSRHPVYNLLGDVQSKSSERINDIKELENNIYGIAIIESNRIYKEKFSSDPKLYDILVADAIRATKFQGSAKEFIEDGYQVMGYTKYNEIVLKTPDKVINERGEVNENKLIAAGARIMKSEAGNYIAYKSDINITNTNTIPGLTDNKDLLNLKHAFEESPLTVGKETVLRQMNVPSGDGIKIPVMIKAFKDSNGRVTYSIEEKKNGVWDNPIGEYGNILTFEKALILLNQFRNKIIQRK